MKRVLVFVLALIICCIFLTSCAEPTADPVTGSPDSGEEAVTDTALPAENPEDSEATEPIENDVSETAPPEDVHLNDEELRYDVISVCVSLSASDRLFLKNSEINRFLDVLTQFDFSEPDGIGGGSGVGGGVPCFYILTGDGEYAAEFLYDEARFVFYPKDESFTLDGRANTLHFDFSEEFSNLDDVSLLALKTVADKALNCDPWNSNEYDLHYPWGDK